MENVILSSLAQNQIEPWEAVRKTGDITKITPHIAKEVNTASALCEKHRHNPYHYYIGFEGDLVCGMSEDCYNVVSNSEYNDYHAITVLLANSDTNPGWPVSDKAINTFIDLCCDLFKRYTIHAIYTGKMNAGMTCHDMFCKTDCPGPFLKSKLREIGFIVYNKCRGLPFEPQRKKGIFRVRRARDDRKSQRGVYSNIEPAIKKAKRWGLNVYDANGIEVYNDKLACSITQWDAYDLIGPGDVVTSKEVPCYSAPGSSLCSLKIGGIWKTYIPALGGYIPNDYITMVDPEKGYKSGVTLFTLDEGEVEEVDELAGRVKVHGFWVIRPYLLKKRNYG